MDKDQPDITKVIVPLLEKVALQGTVIIDQDDERDMIW
jgi:hypothetical protein